MACSCIPKPLSAGKKYHYSVFYNYYEGPASGRQGDHLLSWNFLKELKGKLSDKGYDKCMYNDIARPGSNVFNNIFNMVNESEKIVVLLTPDFLKNGWHTYAAQASVKNLLDNKREGRLVPIAINLKKENIPENIGFSVSLVKCTGYVDNTADDGFWKTVLQEFGPTELHYEQNDDRDRMDTVQPVEIRIPHDNPRDGSDDYSSLQTDCPSSADNAADGDRVKRRSRDNGLDNDSSLGADSSNLEYATVDDKVTPASQGSDRASNGSSLEQYDERNTVYFDAEDAGYKSEDTRSDHSPDSNAYGSVNLTEKRAGCPTKETDQEQSKRPEGDGALSETNTDGKGICNKLKTEDFPLLCNISPSSPTADSQPQSWYRRGISWLSETMDYLEL